MPPLLLALFLALFLVTQSAPQNEAIATMSCGPFLLQPGPRSMTIVIDHESPITAQLRYRPADTSTEVVVTHDEQARHHVFSLEGLAPGTVYNYEITSEKLSTGAHSFRTLPEHPESYRVLALGDVRTQIEPWAQVSTRMFEHEPDALFAIGTGDYPTDGRKYQLWIDEFFTPARAFLGRMPFWPAIGNHEATRRHDDITNLESSHYFSLFELPGNERWYRVDYPLITLLVVDSNSSMSPEQPQYEWLREQLRLPRNRFTIIALHHAPLTSGPHGRLHPDGTPVEWPLDEGRRFLVPLFEMYDVDLVLAGHDHLYERSEKDGVVYVVTGGGGAPLYTVDSVQNPHQQFALSAHHYVALDIDANGIQLTAIDKDGGEIDSAHVPATEKHVERRMRSVTNLLEHATELGPLDTSTHTTRVAIHNPLDHPLAVRIETARRGNRAQPIEETLEPGERREVSLVVEDVGGDIALEPWRAAVALELSVHFNGRDQVLDVELEQRSRATLYRPAYSPPRLASVELDGELSDWKEAPAMVADERTPIVKSPSSYGGPEDFSAELKLAWSDGLLHLLADVTDERIVDDVDGRIDENDCFRVLFDVAKGNAKNVIVHSFSASGRTDSTQEGARLEHATRAREGGWILEASIPLEDLGLTRQDGVPAQLSCDFVFVDRDVEGESAKPSYHRFWTKSRSRWDTSTFGVLVLDD